ncbi:YhgE/Pip family protein [Corynebacterium freiburgense]|uniref:YhgE/Pip family protein n=1 Tax=Corynebacterium freiburgense TaxID=556548 RepID=UPI00041D3965|nr:YhgE/Pip domain-containing protein [Corynebacterium freiburgense]WJZ03821.1 Chromosome partition protein Smc [Corynebacterium freiburgense]
MISGLTLGSELQRFRRSKMGRIALLAITLMPLLYSALYLWAFWNPFAHINRLPVAFVNSDHGTVVEGKPLKAGDKVVEGLQKVEEINFEYVDHQDAIEGVAEGRYYFVVELTQDFSEAVASPATGEARQAVIQTTYNDTNGYLSTMIGENVMRTMIPVISQQIGEEAIDKVLVGVQSAGSGLEKASEGAQQINEGLHSAATGSDELAAGAHKLNDSVATLATGSDQLANGTQQLADSINKAGPQLQQLEQHAQNLEAKLPEITATAQNIDADITSLNQELGHVTAFQTQSSENVRNLANQLRGIQEPNVQNAVIQLDQLANTLNNSGLGENAPATITLRNLEQTTHTLNTQLSNETSPVRQGISQIGSGKLTELQQGVNQLNDGMQTLNLGAHRLHDEGTTPLVAGVEKLGDGLHKLEDGSATLANKLTEGASAVPKWDEEQRRGTASVLGGPVALKATNEAGQNTFGGGLAPFFFSLAMFIGGLIIFLLLRPIQNRAVASGVAPLRAALDGLWPAIIIASLQATVIVAVTMFAVGLDPRYPIGLWAFAVGVSIMFAAVNQMLNVLFGPGPGKVLAMALLMLQILASGGLYPVETQPKFFQLIHPINPMTYSVHGFRQLMYGHIDHRLPQAIAALVIVTLISLTLTSLGARRDRLWTMKRLHPAISV